MTLRIELVTKDNYKIAEKIQATIFPHEKDDLTYKFASGIVKDSPIKYWKEKKSWIIYKNNIPLGIFGIYVYKDYPEYAWGDWMGVLKEYRSFDIFMFIKNSMLKEIKKLGYKAFYLFTDPVENSVAVKLYRWLGMFEEKYENFDKPYPETLIFSESFVEKSVPWDNKYLHIDEFNKYALSQERR